MCEGRYESILLSILLWCNKQTTITPKTILLNTYIFNETELLHTKPNIKNLRRYSLDGDLWRFSILVMRSSTVVYLFIAANSGKSTIRILSEDKDVFVPLVCWVYREEMDSKVQMEWWHMTMRSVCSSNVTCTPSATATWPHIYTLKPRLMRSVSCSLKISQDNALGEVGATQAVP